MAAWMYTAVILPLLLPLPGGVQGSTFHFLCCSDSYNTDATMTTDQAEDKLSALGPVQLVLQDGGNEDGGRSCSVLDLNIATGTYSFGYTENGAQETRQGTVELTKGPPSSIVLRDIGNQVLGAGWDGDAKLYVMTVDESELVLLSCQNSFIFHFESLYVFSNTYEWSSLSETCSVDTLEEMFGKTASLLQDVC